MPKPTKPKKNDPIQLTGKAYCDWNAFAWVNPKPETLQRGDLVIWTWSGDSKEPSSSKDAGRFAVSVFDGKTRRKFKVRNTRVNGLLAFNSDSERAQKLRQLIPELQTLKGFMLEWESGGFQVSLMAPPTTDTTQPAAGASA